MWDTYLKSFPAGTNPVYRTRTEYDCSCCRQFIRAVGNAVAIIDNRLVSIWDVAVDEPAFQTVADALSALVKSKPVENVFLHTERTVGTDKNFEQIVGGVQTWEYFFVNIPQKYVARNTEIGTALSESKALHDVMLRSLKELTDDAVDTVLDLIAQNSLYRGEEHKFAVESFKKLKKEYASCSSDEALAQDNFVWQTINKVPQSVAKIRNTSIGTLLTDLSESRDLEEAVKAFETMVAPANYKRPTALVSKAMVENARSKVDELGLTTALERRYVALPDININDILFADRSAKSKINGSVFDEIASETADRKPKNMDKIEEVHIEKFLVGILPNASSIELMMENSHIKNLVSLVAPVDPTARQLFKWKNNFSWAYKGDVADSIRERVKKAGGNVTGELCCRLAWYNYDDLDFHMIEPDGYEIFYKNKRELSPSAGMLDVDMNVGMGTTHEPVENIFYSTQNRMKEGIYKLQVHQFRKQETDDEGFEVEFDFMGEVKQYAYAKPVR